ncbi:acyl-CoA synthetase [Mycobacteroides abscessus]|uniref:acyl-CoA synthetase n=1 Tax=Mycobacteroides abscessus TaxID=36809 RepID=UPI00092A06DC|nr:acyl-CoA synthetase [Mycobacteroides abscessus]SIJ16231.1 Probable long-chain-fatty-acid-CoA ligase [Mycobacteroides abscessus subsp. bolletii]SKG71817.1 Probable long-chain-fatty-acid-CoA ligase [Mycobacteroides abscessus subsp. bolletii]SKG97418.1 Probable long-chain-fatty-acid-CoA ligase [Mycobacteroides abscessus subsp. bolletii]SKH91467.1 Probable long-chain-fatty-acid-CoA ligase [Mycobacteroides abscessus subsp. bolletii]SKH93050.1 Probable long-chain-fatty-acid-CoA ligase [Mycobacter
MKSDDLLWPCYCGPEDLAPIESIPLSQRGLPVSTYALLHRAARMWPDRPAVTVIPDTTRWREPMRRTFSQLLADVHRSANLLADVGVGRTDAVALIAPNCAQLITAILAAQLAGIAAPINGALSVDHVTELVQRSGARVLIAAAPQLDQNCWDLAEQLARRGVVDSVLVLEAPEGEPTAAVPAVIGHAIVGYLADLAESYDSTTFSGTLPAAGDLAALFHTGGTTGTPKLAAHTHANEVSDAWMIAANSLLDENSVALAALPLFHVNALVVTILAPLLRGQHTVWAGPLGFRDPALYAHLWKIVQHYDINTISAVPTVYSVLSQLPVDADITSLQFALVGASALSESVRRSFQAHTGVPLVQGYGLTEATCASIRSFPDHPRPGSVGQRLPYQQVKIARKSEARWQNLPAGSVGHLLINGPNVFPGYVTARTDIGFELDGRGVLDGGWLDTGDLARIDAEGYVFLAGRAKDLIIRGGHNIDPATTEDALLSHPAVTGAAAVGRPDPHAGEIPVAYVTVAANAQVSHQQLQDWAATHVTEPAAAPKAVTIVDALPVTAIGKPHKLPLRADATRVALQHALTGIGGVRAVEAGVEDGTVTAIVTVGEDADTTAIQTILDCYAVTAQIRRPS